MQDFLHFSINSLVNFLFSIMFESLNLLPIYDGWILACYWRCERALWEIKSLAAAISENKNKNETTAVRTNTHKKKGGKRDGLWCSNEVWFWGWPLNHLLGHQVPTKPTSIYSAHVMPLTTWHKNHLTGILVDSQQQLWSLLCMVTIVQKNLFKQQIHFALVIFIIQHPSLDGKNVASWLDKLCHIKWKSRTTTFYRGCLSLRSHHMDIWESNMCKQI